MAFSGWQEVSEGEGKERRVEARGLGAEK